MELLLPFHTATAEKLVQLSSVIYKISQNVVLLTDLTQNTMKGYERDPDDENRLFYVGATRTKENLHIIEPKKYEKGYIL